LAGTSWIEGTNIDFPPPGGHPGASACPTLEGTEWRLSDHLGPDGALVPVAEEVMATASFSEGRVSGTTGCNRYSGSYRIDGASLLLGSIAMTRMACIPPRDAVERAMTAALETTAGYTLTGDALELTNAEGDTVLRFRAGAGPRLVGTTWVARGINNGRGGVVSSVGLEAAHVTALFAPDGRVAGFGGFNGFGGPYTLDGGSMHIGPLTATRKACVDPEGVGELEGWYFAALERVAAWSIHEGRLQLRDGDGALQVDYRAADAEV
jgi:heat shock protein HslJ